MPFSRILDFILRTLREALDGALVQRLRSPVNNTLRSRSECQADHPTLTLALVALSTQLSSCSASWPAKPAHRK